MRQISLTFSIAIKSSTSKVSPNACSRLLANVTCPIESQDETSLGTVLMVMVCGSMSNADLNAVRTFPSNSSLFTFTIALFHPTDSGSDPNWQRTADQYVSPNY